MEFQKVEQNDFEWLLDQVTICMETGNYSTAKAILIEMNEDIPIEVKAVKQSILRYYGVRL
jgi:hypothetical protein